MDDLIEQLRRLGDASESDAPAVSASEARSLSERPPVIDIGSRHTADTVPAGSGGAERAVTRPVGAKVMAAAAAVVLLTLAGSVLLIRNNDGDPQIDLAGAIQPEDRFAVPDDNGWANLRDCESSGDYTTDTGNTFYGAYQFTRPVWRIAAASVGLEDYAPNPADAPPHVQDAFANALYLERGVDPWPICGRYIEGPMITPVAPQWLGQQRTDEKLTIVVNDPDVDEDQLAEIRTALEAIVLRADGPTAVQIVFIDKEAAFAEFQAMFPSDERIRESVDVGAMPTSFRITASLSSSQLGRLRDIPGVFEVVQELGLIDSTTTAPMRLSIPAIDLEAAIYTTPSIDNLAQGPVVIVNDLSALVVGGYGSVDGSGFGRLDELRSGDVVIVTSLVAEGADRVEVSRTFAVTVGDDAPEAQELDDVLELRRGTDEQLLTLAADIDGSPTKRLIIHAEIAEPDPSLYPADDQ